MIALPSQSSAYDLVAGKRGALPRVAAHAIGRAGIISVGLYAAGAREDVLKLALGASLSIETFVILWAWYHHAAKPERT